MARAFKIGDKVECIKKPPEGNYQCKVGEVMIVKQFVPNSPEIFSRVERPKGTYGECFDVKGFKLANAIDPKDFYNKY